MTAEEFRELSPLYALGALDAETARRVEHYLLTAPEAERHELAELIELAALLPLALPQTPPPVQLKDRLLARLSQDKTAPTQHPAPPTSQLVPFPQSQRTRTSIAHWLQVAATFLLAALSSLLLWQNSQLSVKRDELAHQVKDNKEQLATQQRAFEELLAQTSRMIALVGEAAPQASAKILWDTSRQQWVIYIYNLPLAPPEKDYQLWYITADQQKISAYVFRPDAQGHSQLRLSLPPGLASRLAATAVTLEPRGGSTQPTGQIYLKGTI